MLSDFIGGGQIFLHKIRMFVQVLNKTLAAAFLIGGICSCLYIYPKLKSLDITAAISYQKAVTAVNISDSIQSLRLMMNPNVKVNLPTIDAYTHKGIYAKEIDGRKILRNKYFKKAYIDTKSVIISGFFIFTVVLSLSILLIFTIWSKYGAGAKEKKHIKGHTIKTPREVLSYLKACNKVSHLKLGEMPLVKDSETKHIMITGSTGSGKTNCLHNLLPQIRSKRQRAIIVDTEGDMVSRYYWPGKDILINPFDERTHNWDLWSEIDSNRAIKKLATSFFADSPPDSHNYDSKWTSWAKMLFIGVLEYLSESKEFSVEELYNLIHREPIESLAKKLKNTSAGSLLNSKSENNAAPHNIRINAVEATDWLEFLSDNDDKKFSFKNWFKDFDDREDDSWVFICCDGGDAKILLPFISVLVDIAINSLISLGINRDRRIWFVMDELAKLKYLPALQENITLLRKYGGCVMVATQSFNQILSTYGRRTGSVMLAQFNTNIIFRSKLDEAKLIAKQIGEIEYLNYQKNISFGANDFRDGVSYTEQEKRQELVTAIDIESLKEHEAFILLPEAEVAIAKVHLEIIKSGNSLQIPFIVNPKIDQMISDRQKRWNDKLKLIENDSLLKNVIKETNDKKRAKIVGSDDTNNSLNNNEIALNCNQEKALNELVAVTISEEEFLEE